MDEGPEPVRAAARRPRVALVDVFETMLQVEGLRPRFVDVGRPGHEGELFFTRTLRDGMALTLRADGVGRARIPAYAITHGTTAVVERLLSLPL